MKISNLFNRLHNHRQRFHALVDQNYFDPSKTNWMLMLVRTQRNTSDICLGCRTISSGSFHGRNGCNALFEHRTPSPDSKSGTDHRPVPGASLAKPTEGNELCFRPVSAFAISANPFRHVERYSNKYIQQALSYLKAKSEILRYFSNAAKKLIIKFLSICCCCGYSSSSSRWRYGTDGNSGSRHQPN